MEQTHQSAYNIMLSAHRIEPSLSADLLYQFPERPKHVFIIKKETNEYVDAKASELAIWLQSTQHVTVFIEQAVYDSEQRILFERCCPYVPSKHRQIIELVITLGGDGTVLHANSLFNDQYPTPVLLSFAMGTLGFLTPFNFDDYPTVITQLLSACSTSTKSPTCSTQCKHLETSDETMSPCKNNSVTGALPLLPIREPQTRLTRSHDTTETSTPDIQQQPNGCVISLCPRMRLLCQVWKRKPNQNADHSPSEAIPSPINAASKQSVPNCCSPPCDLQEPSFVDGLQDNPSHSNNTRIPVHLHQQADLYLASTFHPLNELLLSNATCRNLTSIDLSLIQENGKAVKVSTVLADALIISSATGSTAYSMSAGGPMVSPNTHCIIVTPVCPHSLSFRPLILPDSTHLLLSISASSRSDDGLIVCDGSNKGTLKKGEWVTIKQDSVPVWSVNWVGKIGPNKPSQPNSMNNVSYTDEVDSSVLWFRSISSKLNWNQSANQPNNIHSAQNS